MKFMNAAQKVKKGKVEERIQTLILDSMASSRIREPRRRPYGSDISFCPRKNVYAANLEYEQHFTAANKFYMGVGICVEDMVTSALSKEGNLLINSYWLNLIHPNDPKLAFGGQVDLIIKDEDNYYLVDVKTTKRINDQMKKVGDSRQVVNKGLDDDMPNYVSQVQFYSALTGFDPAFLVYVSRQGIEKFNGDLEMFVSRVDTSDEALTNAITRAYYSQLCIENDLLPKIPKGFRKTVECKFCDFYDLCYGDEQIEFDESVEMMNKLYHEASLLAEQFMGNRAERHQLYLKDIERENKKRQKKNAPR